MKDHLGMNQDILAPFQGVKVQQVCQTQLTEREQRNFKGQLHRQERIKDQIVPIFTLDTFRH